MILSLCVSFLGSSLGRHRYQAWFAKSMEGHEIFLLMV